MKIILENYGQYLMKEELVNGTVETDLRMAVIPLVLNLFGDRE